MCVAIYVFIDSLSCDLSATDIMESCSLLSYDSSERKMQPKGLRKMTRLEYRNQLQCTA